MKKRLRLSSWTEIAFIKRANTKTHPWKRWFRNLVPRFWLYGIVPIPGTTKRHRLKENLGAANFVLTAQNLQAIESASFQIEIEGARYPAHLQETVGR